jgi:ubiquinol oxidase
MEKAHDPREFENLSASLSDDSVRSEYERLGAGYQASFVPRLLGSFLIACGNLIYGREPSYLKFRAIEVIARVPYHSWESAAYTLLTLFYTNEEKAVRLTEGARFSRLAQDNETMHVVVISALVGKRRQGMRYGVVPVLFAWFYFWASYVMYLMRPKWSYELNYLFENHAYHQYSRFIKREGEHLKVRPIDSEFLRRYGRNPRSQLEFFCQVRNDELIHRNQSLHNIGGFRG